MVVPFDVAPGNLQASAYGEVDGAIGNDNVASLAESGYDARDGGEGLGVNNATLGADVRRDIGLRLHVYILGAVELRGPAGTNTVGSQHLDSLLLDLLVGIEVVEVVRT